MILPRMNGGTMCDEDFEEKVRDIIDREKEQLDKMADEDVGVDGLEPVAWRCPECFHTVHMKEAPYRCYDCGGEVGKPVEWEPLFTGRQVEQEIEDARIRHCRRAEQGKPLCRTANEGSFQEIRCHVCAALNYLKGEVAGQ